MPLRSRLALGTVQFGLRYGIANQVGQTSCDEAAAILAHAWAGGLDTLDTAIAYGESEQRLGEIGVNQWQVISKLPPVPGGITDVTTWVQESVLGSLKRIGVSKINGLLLHRSQDLLGPQGELLYRAMVMLKDQGQVEKIGVSIYDPDELEALCPYFHLDLVQAPFNIIDRRLASSGWLTKLRQAGTEVYTRSVFLQGLLLMGEAKRPEIFNRWQPLWRQWHLWLEEQSLTPLQACLAFVGGQNEIDRVVVGVDSLRHLQEILNGSENHAVTPPLALMSEDLDLINPSRWNTL